MTRMNLKEEIRRVLQSDWPAFAQAHPRLAEVIDQDLLIESIAAELSVSAEYRQAIADAEKLSFAADTLSGHIRSLVRQSLRALRW